mgnify:CR=1 FL=1
MSVGLLPQISDIEAAEGRLAGYARVTPLLESPRLNALADARLLIKPECLQRTGSFKFRGAFNKIAQIPEERRARGVVAFSSGNHAQGVGAAAKILGLPATIVMPSDAPAIKIENTKNYGAKIVFYDRADGNRVAVAEDILAQTDGTLIPPYNDFDVIAGQGTIGLELAREAEALEASFDIVLGPSSGGGMMAGVALAFASCSPDTSLYSVEPNQYDDIAQSLATGDRVIIEVGMPSLCDALLLETPGKLTFEIMKSRLAGGVSVSDEEALAAVRVAFDELKIVLEPSGATALAAVLQRKIDVRGKIVGIICSGGNVDPDIFVRALQS